VVVPLTALALLVVAALVLLAAVPLGPHGVPPWVVLRRRLIEHGWWSRTDDVPPASGALVPAERDEKVRRWFEQAEHWVLRH
jgi:hypothetical protein